MNKNKEPQNQEDAERLAIPTDFPASHDYLDQLVAQLKQVGTTVTSFNTDTNTITFGSDKELAALLHLHGIYPTHANAQSRSLYDSVIQSFANHTLTEEEARKIWDLQAVKLADQADPLMPADLDEEDWFLTSLSRQFKPLIETITDHLKTQQILDKWK